LQQNSVAGAAWQPLRDWSAFFTEILTKQTFGSKGLYSKKSGVFSGGWIRCKECGCSIVYDPKTKLNKQTGNHKTYHYYRCSNGKKVHTSMTGMNVNEKALWEQLENSVGEITISRSFAEKIAEALNEASERAKKASVREGEKFKAKIQELEISEDELLHHLTKGTIEEKQFGRVLAEIRETKSYLTDRLTEAHQKINAAVTETAQSVIELCMDARSLWKGRSEGERLEFLDDILSNRWLDGSSVRYELKKPFQVMSEMNQKEDWRSLRESNPCLRRERATLTKFNINLEPVR
jgi:uncharacterized OB-fold protein